MKEQINFSVFCDRFKDMNRDNNFSYDGKRVLYDYLIELEEDTGKEMELDIIAICCDYSEYENIEEYLNDYYTTDEINEIWENHKQETEEETRNAFKIWLEEEINNKTTLIKFKEDLDEGFIIQQY